MKQTRKEKKEAERRMLAELDAEVAKEREQGEESKQTGQQYHCSRCRTLMQNGKCPTCGHTMYVPMDKDKQKKIRTVVTVVCVAVFVVLFVWLQLK